MDKEEHEDNSFGFRMQIETKGMNPAVKEAYIHEKRQKRLYEKWDREDELDAEFQTEGDQWYRAFEIDMKEKEEKKRVLLLMNYHTKNKNN